VKHLFILAGVPHELASLLDGDKRKKASGDGGSLIVEPARTIDGVPRFDAPYRDRLLEIASDWVCQQNVDTPFSLSLIHANTELDDMRDLINAFFPFSLRASFEPLHVAQTHNQRRQTINEFIIKLQKMCSELRSCGKSVCEHLTSRARSTPLLLPIENFDSNELRSTLRALYDLPSRGTAFDAELSRAAKALAQRLSKERGDTDRCDYFVNTDHLLFVPPGNHSLHGLIATKGSGHRAHCLLAGRVRLGGSYNPRFHYDCKPIRGNLKSLYPSCHGQLADSPRHTHVNIAPNDNVR